MTATLEHQSVEQEVARLLAAPEGASDSKNTAASRETALALLCRAAQNGEDIRQLLEEGGSLAAAALATDLFAIAELQSKGNSLTVIGGTAVESQTNRQFESAFDPKASALAFTINAGHPIVITELQDESRFDDEWLRSQRVRSGVLCPLIHRMRPQGVMGVFTKDWRHFTRDDALCLHAFAGLLGPTIAHQRAERALADQSKFVASTIDSLESMVVVLGADGRIQQINRAGQSICGFRLDEIKTRSFGGAFLLPEEIRLVDEAIHRLKIESGPIRCETFLLTRDASRRRIAWSFSSLPFESQDGPAVIASGIDISEQFEAIARVSDSTGNGSSRPLIMPVDTQVHTERRGHQRLEYPYIQSIAPCHGGVLPTRVDFQNVRCRDISPTGFAYLGMVEPDFETLVVKLGPTASQLFVRARVAHTTQLEQDGRRMCLVGCKYVSRVELQR